MHLASALTQSGMLRSEISSMSRLAFSSCTIKMNQTEVIVNQPKMCGTMRLVRVKVSLRLRLTVTNYVFTCIAYLTQLRVRCARMR